MISRIVPKSLYLIMLKHKYSKDLVDHSIEIYNNIEYFSSHFGKNFYSMNGFYLTGSRKAESFDKAVRLRYMSRTGHFPTAEIMKELREGIWIYMNWNNKEKKAEIFK